MRVSVRTDVSGLRAQYRDVREQQVPFATSVAINRTLVDGYNELGRAIATSFDAPTPWALRGVRYEKSTKSKLKGRIFLDDFAGKGIPASKFLKAQVYGGHRRDKRSEALLRSKGLLPSGYVLVPGEAAPLDAYGNIPGAFMVKVLAALQSFGEQGFKANLVKGSRADKKMQRAGVAYFVGRPGGRLPLGIWERRQFAHGSAVKPVMIFVRTPVYQVRLDFFEIWQNVVRQRFPEHMRTVLQEALATARR